MKIEELEAEILNCILAEDEREVKIDCLLVNERTRDKLRSHLGFDQMPVEPPHGFVDVWVTSFGPVEIHIDPKLDDDCYWLHPEQKTPLEILNLEAMERRTMEKTLHNTTVSQAKDNVSDLEVYGNGDIFKLISKAHSKREGWMKSTKAMEIKGLGCVVQVTTQQWDHVAEALTFVPGVEIKIDDKGERFLGRIQ